MNSLGFAWRSLIRQPARTALGVLGVAAVGALLFDMLLLSQGLLISMSDLFDRAGFDLRVTATDALPGQGPRLAQGIATAGSIARLPGVRAAIALRFADATLDAGTMPVRASLQGISGDGLRPWTLVRGRDLAQPRDVLVNENAAMRLGLSASPTSGVTGTIPKSSLTSWSSSAISVGVRRSTSRTTCGPRKRR